MEDLGSSAIKLAVCGAHKPQCHEGFHQEDPGDQAMHSRIRIPLSSPSEGGGLRLLDNVETVKTLGGLEINCVLYYIIAMSLWEP